MAHAKDRDSGNECCYYRRTKQIGRHDSDIENINSKERNQRETTMRNFAGLVNARRAPEEACEESLVGEEEDVAAMSARDPPQTLAVPHLAHFPESLYIIFLGPMS